MKKIEAIIKRKNFSAIKIALNTLGTYIVDKRNLTDSNIYDESQNSDGLRSIPLTKIELVISDKDARKVVELISKNSGLSSTHGGKIFVSEMVEVVDMQTLDGLQDLEISIDEKLESKDIPKRSRLVPLQKFTLQKLQSFYEENKETLHNTYRIKSFTDFVNYCIMKSLPYIEKQLRENRITNENTFRTF